MSSRHLWTDLWYLPISSVSISGRLHPSLIIKTPAPAIDLYVLSVIQSSPRRTPLKTASQTGKRALGGRKLVSQNEHEPTTRHGHEAVGRGHEDGLHQHDVLLGEELRDLILRMAGDKKRLLCTSSCYVLHLSLSCWVALTLLPHPIRLVTRGDVFRQAPHAHFARRTCLSRHVSCYVFQRRRVHRRRRRPFSGILGVWVLEDQAERIQSCRR